MPKHEIRFLKELRADGQGDEMVLVGYAALFGVESKDLGGFREMVAPGTFKRSLDKGDDVKALFNHDPNKVLGRTKNGTLKVTEDERGLLFRCQLDPTNTDHRNLHSSVKRGDIDECSFAFTVPDGGQKWSEKQGDTSWYPSRTLTDVNLMDISAVTYPAYPNTAVIARGEDVVPAEIRSAIAAHNEKRDDESYEHEIGEVSKAVDKAFPKLPSTVVDGCCYSGGGRFYVMETHDGYVVVCEWASNKCFKIEYKEDEATETFTFSAPVEVECEYVPVDDRAAKRLSEFRVAKANDEQRSADALAEQHKKAAADAAAVAAEHERAAAAITAADEARKAKLEARKKRMEDEGWDPEDYDPEIEEDEMDERFQTARAKKLADAIASDDFRRQARARLALWDLRYNDTDTTPRRADGQWHGIKVGDHVKHETDGSGTVVRVEDDDLDVEHDLFKGSIKRWSARKCSKM